MSHNQTARYIIYRIYLRKIGYARFSTIGQTLNMQLEKFNACPKIFKEKRSATTHSRPELNRCLSILQKGDILVVTRLDRLTRSILDLCQIAESLKEREPELFKVIDQNINTSSHLSFQEQGKSTKESLTSRLSQNTLKGFLL